MENLGAALIAAAAAWICARALRVRRTRQLGWIGLGAALLALAACLWAATTSLEEGRTARLGPAFALLAVGFAHAVRFSVSPLPANAPWLRVLVILTGLWACTLAAIGFVLPERGMTFQVAVGVSWALALASLVIAQWSAADRGFVRRGGTRIPSVRFDCPRCGVRADWPRGITACTDCGLFLHLDWPAQRRADTAPAPERTLRFACPNCRQAHAWPVGTSACSACGVLIALHWNVQAEGVTKAKARG